MKLNITNIIYQISRWIASHGVLSISHNKNKPQNLRPASQVAGNISTVTIFEISVFIEGKLEWRQAVFRRIAPPQILRLLVEEY